MDADHFSDEGDDEYFYLPKAFMLPQHAMDLPKGDEMRDDTSFPQISSAAFRHETYKNIVKRSEFLPFYTLLELSSEGLFVIGTNDFQSSITAGNFIGTNNFESIVQSHEQNTSFALPKQSTVTALKLLDTNTVRKMFFFHYFSR